MGEKSRSRGCCGWFLVLVILGLIAGAIVFAVKKKSSHSDDDPAPVPGPPGAIQKKYSDALKMALRFFDVQKCNLFHLISHFNIFCFYDMFLCNVLFVSCMNLCTDVSICSWEVGR